jgi:3',5'-cyclic AMP phosphodiesterase CpdA
MANILRWIHLSDLHMQSPMPDGMLLVLDALWKDIPGQIERLGGPLDFIAFTGDVAKRGKVDEYDLAEKFFFVRLLEETKVPRSRLFVVPGNHDVDWDLVDMINHQDLRKMIQEHTDLVLGENNRRRIVFDTMPAYTDFIRHLVVGTGNPMYQDPAYAYSADLGPQHPKIAVLGLNTAWFSGYDRNEDHKVRDRGSLRIGGKQLQQVFPANLNSSAPPKADLRIVLMHHPLEDLDEGEKRAAEIVFQKERCLVLQGHLHEAKVESLTTLVGQVVCMPAGTIYKDEKWLNGYTLVRLDLETGKGTAYLRRYSDARGFVADILSTGERKPGVVPFKVRLLSANQVPSTTSRSDAQSAEADRLLGSLKPIWLRVGRRGETQLLLDFLDQPRGGLLWIWGTEDRGIREFLHITRAVLQKRQIQTIETTPDDLEMLTYWADSSQEAPAIQKSSCLLLSDLHLLKSQRPNLEYVSTAFRERLQAWPGNALGICTWEDAEFPADMKGVDDTVIQLPEFRLDQIEDFFRGITGITQMREESIRDNAIGIHPGFATGDLASPREVYDRLKERCITGRWL